MTLAPIVDMIGNAELHHGERGDLDPVNSYACLCGEPDYLQCPHFDGGILSWTISRVEEA